MKAFRKLLLLRGGSWYYYPRYCRSAYRSHVLADNANYLVGLRVVCVSLNLNQQSK